MPLLEPNWKPSDRQLRQFGLLCAPALVWLGWMSSIGGTALIILALIGLSLFALSAVAPRLIAPLYLGLILVTIPMGMIVGELVLLATYFLVFLPIGVLFRIMARDRLRLRRKPDATSYWEPKAKPKSVASYYRQS